MPLYFTSDVVDIPEFWDTVPTYEFDRELTEFTTLGLYQYGTDVKVSVYKVGGGTIGRQYPGNWGYLVETLDERVISQGEDFYTGTPHDHQWVAETVLDILNED